MTEQPAVTVRSVDDVDISPFQRPRRRRQEGRGKCAFLMRVVMIMVVAAQNDGAEEGQERDEREQLHRCTEEVVGHQHRMGGEKFLPFEPWKLLYIS